MRRVMDGIMYDSATSEELARMASPRGTAEDEAWSEILYRKASGQYWLYAEGGKSTIYSALNRCNIFDGSWCIKALAEDEARTWCEHNLGGDAYEAIWGPVDEDLVCATPEQPADNIKQAIRDTWLRAVFASKKFDKAFISEFLEDDDADCFEIIDDI